MRRMATCLNTQPNPGLTIGAWFGQSANLPGRNCGSRSVRYPLCLWPLLTQLGMRIKIRALTRTPKCG